MDKKTEEIKKEKNQIYEEIEIEKDYDYKFNVLIIGDTLVGKSCLFFHFEDNKFHESFSPTIGLDLRSKLMKVKVKILN